LGEDQPHLTPRDHAHANNRFVTFEPDGGVSGEPFPEHGSQNEQSPNKEGGPIHWLQGIQDTDINRRSYRHEEKWDKEMAELGNAPLYLMGL
jgi:hypothetical protein